MRAQISKWGDSLAIRLPQAAAKSLRVREGEDVEITIDRGRLEIRAARLRYDLDELLNQITPDNQPEPIDVAPAGEELL